MRSLIVLSLLFMMSGCGQQPLSKQVFSGTLEITEHLLGPKVSGRVVTLLVKEGSKV